VKAGSGFVSAATDAAPIVITSANHGLRTGDQVKVTGALGNAAANGTFTVAVLDANRFSLNGSSGSGTYLGGGSWQRFGSITNASGALGTPVVITAASHGLNTGDQVAIKKLTGNTGLNGNSYYVTVIDADHFSLNGTSADGSTTAGGSWSLSNRVLLKSAIGAADQSGLNESVSGFSQTPFVLNSVDPRLMLLGISHVYEDADPTAANGYAGDVVTDITTNVGTLNGRVSALTYGGVRGGKGFTNVAFVGTSSGQLFFRGESGSAFTDVTAKLGSTSKIDSIALDPTDWWRVYVVTGNQVFFTAKITALGANPFQLIGGGANDNLASLSAGLGNLGAELHSITLARIIQTPRRTAAGQEP
jgi:hypothetical protein